MIKTASLIFVCLLSLNSCTQRSTEDQVIEWVSNHAIPIKSVEPGTDMDDLTPLKNIIGNARIVSLGEPTHGNREVFQLKHRMIEYLVTEMDFNLFALECPFGEALDINRYVVDGIGDPEKALAGIYFWTWDTEEVLALIEWMRNYNSDPKNVKKVKFYGFDPQDPQRATRVMLEYLEKVDPILEQSVRPELGILEVPFSDPINTGRRQWIPEEYDSLALRQIQRVMTSFQNKKESYVSSSSIKEWQLAKQHARQTEIYIESNINDGINYGSVRDLGQAENIRWALNHEGGDAKAIVWAHNFHVSNNIIQEEEKEGLEYLSTELMGSHLKKWYQDQVMIIGFFYNQGGFTALDDEVPSKGMQTFSVGPAKTGSLENMMIKAGLTNAFLDVSEVPSDGLVSEWFNNPIPTRYSWGAFNQSEEDNYYYPHKLASEFDALIFLDKTTPTIPVDSLDYENIWLLDKKLSQPTNLDFEESEIGETPAGWFAWSKFKRLGVTITTSEQAYQGKKSLMMYRPPGLAYGEVGSNVVQTIDATPYRGKKIRFKGVAKAELEDDTFAFLHLKIEAGFVNNVYSGDPPLFDSLDKYRINNSEWRHYRIEAKVPENADKITYSIHLRDFGTVWLDVVQIEIIN